MRGCWITRLQLSLQHGPHTIELCCSLCRYGLTKEQVKEVEEQIEEIRASMGKAPAGNEAAGLAQPPTVSLMGERALKVVLRAALAWELNLFSTIQWGYL